MHNLHFMYENIILMRIQHNSPVNAGSLYWWDGGGEIHVCFVIIFQPWKDTFQGLDEIKHYVL